MTQERSALFSDMGAYHARDGKPLRADVHFLAPEDVTCAESASILELAGRMAWETLFVPERVVDQWLPKPGASLRAAKAVVVCCETVQRWQALQAIWRLPDDGFACQPGFHTRVTQRQQTWWVIVGQSASDVLQRSRALAATITGINHSSASLPASATNTQVGDRHALHAFTDDPAWVRVDAQGIRTFIGTIQLRGAGRPELSASLTLLTSMVASCHALQFPLTFVATESLPAGKSEFGVLTPALSSDEGSWRVETVGKSITVTFPAHPTPEALQMWWAYMAPCVSRESPAWRQRMNDLTGTNLDRSHRALAQWMVAGNSISPRTNASPSAQMEWGWQDPGERKDLSACVADAIAWLHDQGGSVGSTFTMDIYTSVSDLSRQQVRDEARNRTSSLPVPLSVRMFHTHKTGLHWIRETVIPELESLQGVTSVQITARRYVPGASRHASLGMPALDHSIRYLQECFPADVFVAQHLGLPEDAVTVGLRDDGPRYEVIAWGASGQRIGIWTAEGFSTERPYLPSCENLGTVCVSLAGVRIVCDNELVMEYPVVSDAERVWNFYEGVVLPKVRDVLREPSAGIKFEQLELHAWIDCEDIPLVELETSSVGEALAEDIYFDTLDSMRYYAAAMNDPSWQRPGAIIPYIHTKPGVEPRVRVILTPVSSAQEVRLQIDGTTERIVIEWPAPRRDLYISCVEAVGGEWQVSLAGEQWPTSTLASLGRWLTAPCDSSQTLISRQNDWQHDALYAEDMEALLHEHADAMHLEDSFLGRPIWLLEALEKLAGHRAHPVKQALWKPTLYINARHHANEVSSTNAALLLHQDVNGTDVLQRVNIVLLPLQNVDGAATHQSLCVEHPWWMHHAARFNAVGVEFANEYFNPDTVFGEARTYAHVWETWRPDVFLDDHGIPAHEWVQPFAGYGSPPHFPVSYWIPQARLYTIWQRLTSCDGVRERAQLALEQHVAEFIGRDDAVREANDRLLRRYAKWGHALEPEYFPLTLTHGMLTFSRSHEANSNSRSPLLRYPDQVTADLVTETDDETVSGEALSERVHAHLVVHNALLEWMTTRVQPLRIEHAVAAEGNDVLRLVRPRPLQG